MQGAAERAAEQATEGVAGLENEVKNVMSGLGSFWGKVRKQVRSVSPFPSRARRARDAMG